MLHTTAQSLEDELVPSTIPSPFQLASDITYINSMLTKLAMDCPLAILSLPTDTNDEWSAGRRWELGQACSVLIPLLQTRVREQAFRGEVEDRVRRLAEDLQERAGQLGRQQARSEELERQVATLREQLRVSEIKCKTAESAASKGKEEATRLRAAFQLKEKQFMHELRKREHQFDRLKEQLQSHFNKEMLLSGGGIERAELARLAITAEPGHRMSIYGEMVHESELMSPSDREEQDEDSAEPLVDRLAGLESENEGMRALLLSIQQLLQELRQALELDDFDGDNRGGQQMPILEAAVAGMPVGWILEDLKAEIEGGLAQLSARVAHLCGIQLQ